MMNRRTDGLANGPTKWGMDSFSAQLKTGREPSARLVEKVWPGISKTHRNYIICCIFVASVPWEDQMDMRD